MTALTKRTGPTRTWKTINGKKVKTKDGKDIGKIKEISENHLLLEQGRVLKHKFWIPKYVADAFDGKVLWLMLSEEEVRSRYQYGKEPPTRETYASEFDHFRKTPRGQRVRYASDFNENIRVVKNYSNIRDLSTAQTGITGLVKEEIDTPRKGDDQIEKDKNIKDTERPAEHSKQPTNINLPRTIEAVGKPTEPELQSPPIIVGSHTSIKSDKSKEKDRDTDIQPIMAEMTQPMVEVRPEEQQIMPVSESEKMSLDLTTTTASKSTSIEEAKPTSTSLMPANPESNQISLYDEGHKATDVNGNVSSTLGGYFDPFLTGMAMWQVWLNMCSEFAAIGASLSLSWLESFWEFLIPPSKEATDNR
jgi:hypothetical protein